MLGNGFLTVLGLLHNDLSAILKGSKYADFENIFDFDKCIS